MNKLAVFLLFASPGLIAATTETVWNNPACQTGDCELKSARYFLTKRNDLRNGVAGNSLVASFETANPSALKKYAFVQYLRGCHFAKETSGIRMGIRNFFGDANRPFKHVGWEIDSAWDRDPIYNSFSEAGFDTLREYEIPRNASYFNANPNTARSYDWWSGRIDKITTPILYMSDDPTFSSWTPSPDGPLEVVTSLQFRTCIHEVSDVPSTVDGPGEVIPKAIHCFEWSSNYRMNSTQTALEEKTELASFCQN